MSALDGRRASEDNTPVIKNYEGFGELVTGGSDSIRVLCTAICMLNNPLINQYLLDSRLKLKDRITGTVIFPRDGMLLLNEEIYKAPIVETLELPTENV